LGANWRFIRQTFSLVQSLLESPKPSGLKRHPAHFTRHGPLSVDLIITLLLHLVADGGRRGYRHLLDAFWGEAKSHGLRLPTDQPISAAAFCKARQKLRPEVIRCLVNEVAEAFDWDHGKLHRFCKRRILAIDCSKMFVQRTAKLWREFGGPPASHAPQLTLTVLYDVIGKVVIDGTIAPYGCNERDQMIALLSHVQPGDVLVLDRGFPSYEVIEVLFAKGIDYVMGVPATRSFPAIKSFLKSRQMDGGVVIVREKSSYREGHGPFQLRLVKHKGIDGKSQLLLTSLGRSEFSTSKIIALYRRRWEIELCFRLQKSDYVGHGQFHAQTPEGVKQEVYAMLLFFAISRHFMAAAAKLHKVAYRDISQKGAILTVAGCLTRLLLEHRSEHALTLLQEVLIRLSRRLERVRPGRSFPRRSFRPRPRWGPQGRVFDPLPEPIG